MDFTHLTAQIMSNRKFVDKLDIEPLNNPQMTLLREIEFYKFRITELTDALLNDREHIESHLTKDVLIAFNNYARTCACFFRTKDMNDINQKEHYSDFHLSTKEEKTEEEALRELDELCGDGDIPFHCADTIMMRQIQIKSNLDNFVKYNRKEAPIILPKQKEIDLEHPELKNKTFFPPPPPPPPLTQNPPESPSSSNDHDPTVSINEVESLSKAIIEEMLLEIVEKIESIPLKKEKKASKKKKTSKKIENIYIDL